MSSSINKAFEPSVPFSDKLSRMTAANHTQTFHADSGLAIVEKIQNLLCSTNSKLEGLLLLETALRQNPDVYIKQNWSVVLNDILEGLEATELKKQACRIFCLILPYMAKDSNSHKIKLHDFIEDLLELLLSGLKKNCEWFEASCEVVLACTKYFPQVIGKSKVIQDALDEFIYKQISQSVSNKLMQRVGEIYSELTNCVPNFDPEVYEKRWACRYEILFSTMQKILDKLLNFLCKDRYIDDDEYINCVESMFEIDDPAPDAFQEATRAVRRYINLCTCLAKMLSHKTRFPVIVPVRSTLNGLIRNFQYHNIANVKPVNIEVQVYFTSLSQMQIANLTVLEALLLNFNLGPYHLLIKELLGDALQISKLSTISSEPVYQTRLAVYIFLDKWIKRHGNIACGDVIRGEIFGKMLEDISLDDGKPQTSTKSKKVISNYLKHNPVQQKVCNAALKALKSLVYFGVNLMSTQLMQELFPKVSQISSTLLTSFYSFPFPYDDALCRESLYAVLLAIAINSKPNETEPLQYSVGIFDAALRDPSQEVSSFCQQAQSTLRMCLHPKKPSVDLVDTGKQRQTAVIPRFPQWSTDAYVENLQIETTSNVPPESTNCRISQTFHDCSESAIEDDEPMEDDLEESHYSEQGYSEYSEPYMAKYPEQVSSGQRNGEDMLEVIHSSECQDDVDSDEEEDEEDEDDGNYGEEDINEEDIPTETICMPSTSKLQGMTPVHINQETDEINLEEPEYPPIKHCSKPESSIECKNKLNGVQNSVPEDIPSTSRQCLTSENGIDNSDEELLEEEEEVEEEEEIESFPAEKRPPDFYASAATPASKKPKLESVEEEEKPSDERRSMSPPLQVMKDSFCVDFKDEAKS